MKYLILYLFPIYAYAGLTIQELPVQLTKNCIVHYNQMKVALKIRGECHFVNHRYTDAIRVVTNTRHFYVVLVENNTHVTAVVIRRDKKIIASVEKRKKSDHYDKDTYFSLSWGIK